MNRFIPERGVSSTPNPMGDNPMADTLRTQAEAELRKVRIWIAAVGSLMFCVDMAMMKFVIGGFDMTFVAIDCAILGTFLVLAFAAKYKPVVCCVVALCIFWALQLLQASQDISTLKNGIIIKVLFTLAMVQGIKTAGTVEDLRKRLDNVFS